MTHCALKTFIYKTPRPESTVAYVRLCVSILNNTAVIDVNLLGLGLVIFAKISNTNMRFPFTQTCLAKSHPPWAWLAYQSFKNNREK